MRGRMLESDLTGVRAMRPAPGFTRVELLVAMAVFAVLATLAMHSAAEALATGRATGYRAALADGLMLALNDSTAHRRHVVVCTSADGATCTGGADWTPGWIAWVDHDGNRLRDPGDALLRVHPRLAGGVRVRSSNGRTLVAFQPAGGATAGSNATFTFCSDRNDRAGTLVLANSGRWRTDEATAAQGEACRAMP